MARKSRKKPFASTDNTCLQNPHLDAFLKDNTLATAAYIRLSVENGGHETDESLQTQIQLVHTFIQEQKDLSLTETYIDNGVTGTRFDRPEFVRLMEDVRRGRIQCIVVKDLSRFGRDYLETGYYLDQVFPLLNVRFIAITDRYDSEYADSRNSITVPVKNMVNALFAKDLSKKHEVAFRLRREKGLISKGNAPYGYTYSSEKNQLEIDAVVEPYVRLIFAWSVAGVPRADIARRLRVLGAPTPGKHRFSRDSEWRSESVRYFQRNPAFIGTIALGKSRACPYKDTPNHTLPQSEWYKFPHVHEPYWTEEEYESLQEQYAAIKKKLQEVTTRSERMRLETPDVFQGKVYCGKCGKLMWYKREMNAQTDEVPQVRFYSCKSGNKSSECAINRRIELNALEMIVMRQTQLVVQTACNQKEVIEKAIQKQGLSKKLLPIERKIGRLAEKNQELDDRLLKAYTDFADQLLSEDEYRIIKEKYREMQKTFMMEQRELQRKLDDMKREVERFCRWTDELKAGMEGIGFNEKLVSQIVSKIIVEDIHHITVVFRCQDVYRQEMIDEYLAETAGM